MMYTQGIELLRFPFRLYLSFIRSIRSTNFKSCFFGFSRKKLYCKASFQAMSGLIQTISQFLFYSSRLIVEGSFDIFNDIPRYSERF